MQQMIVISGPTASGKTALSVEIAKQFNTVIISADSRQCYREMTIGTAKPSPQEMDGINHYFIDSHPISSPVSAAQFESEAMALIEGKLASHQKLILVGGSGMVSLNTKHWNLLKMIYLISQLSFWLVVQECSLMRFVLA